MKCDIVAYKAHDLIGKLIGRITNGYISHVAMMVNDNTIIESGWLGVKLSRLDENLKNIEIYRCESLKDEQRRMILNFVYSSINKGYDWKMFFGIGIHRILKLKNNWDNKSRYICSELVYSAYKYAGIKLLHNANEKDISPQDLIGSKKLRKLERQEW